MLTDIQKEVLLLHTLMTTSGLTYNPNSAGNTSGSVITNKVAAAVTAVKAADWNWPNLTPDAAEAFAQMAVEASLSFDRVSQTFAAPSELAWQGSEHPPVGELVDQLAL